MSKSLSDLTNEELWQLFPIIISEHQDRWADDYISEESVLLNAIGKGSVLRINHIGSTYIPNLLAKPTIDILLEIKDDTAIDTLIKNIESAGYIYNQQPDNPPPHMMFMKGYTTEGFKGQAYHVHVRYFGDWDELYFRDYLLSHPETATKYGELKLELKKTFEHNRDGYTNAKTSFIREITSLARKEFPERYKLV